MKRPEEITYIFLDEVNHSLTPITGNGIRKLGYGTLMTAVGVSCTYTEVQAPVTITKESGQQISNLVEIDTADFIKANSELIGPEDDIYGYKLGTNVAFWIHDTETDTAEIYLGPNVGNLNHLTGALVAGSGEPEDSVWYYTDENDNPTSQALYIDLPTEPGQNIVIYFTLQDINSQNQEVYNVPVQSPLASKVYANIKPVSITLSDGLEMTLTPTAPVTTATSTLAPTIEATATPEVVNMTLEDWKEFFNKESDAVMGKRLDQIFEPKFSDYVLYGEEGSKILEMLDKNRPYVILSNDGRIIFFESREVAIQMLSSGSTILVPKETHAPVTFLENSLIAANSEYLDGNIKINGEPIVTIEIKTEEVTKLPKKWSALTIELDLNPSLLIIEENNEGKMWTPIIPKSPLQITLFNSSGDAMTIDLVDNSTWVDQVYENFNNYKYLLIIPQFKTGASVY